MALISFGFISDGSGAVGGLVITRTKGGLAIRARVSGTNPKSPRQTASRALFSQIASAWRSLGQDQRTAWDVAAAEWPYQNRLGQTQFLSGMALFQKLNTNRFLVGIETLMATPPDKPEIPLFSGVMCEGKNTGALFSLSYFFTAASMPEGWVVQIFATPPVSPGRNSRKYERVIGVFSSLTSGKIEAGEPYIEAWGDAPAGSRVNSRVSLIHLASGQRLLIGTMSAIISDT